MHFVYILQSLKDRTHYIGITSSLINRVNQHNAKVGGFTKGHAPYKLIFYCAFTTKIKAAEFERYLKSGSGSAFIRKRLV